MSESRSPASSPVVELTHGPPPYLVWPVARREFFMSICIALIPTLAWGAALFGYRAFIVIFSAVAGSLLVHLPLRRFTQRGKRLLVMHTLVSALVLAALADPLWPGWLILIASALMTLLIFILGGPGRERVSTATLTLAVLAILVIRGVVPPRHAPDTAPVVARDRVFMGDLRNHDDSPASRWPYSWQISGNDAELLYRPAAVVNGLFDTLSASIRPEPADALDPRAQARDAVALAAPAIDDALVRQLPPMESLVYGIAPGSLGTVSAIGIFLGGLYLAYRTILRPRSFTIFILAFILGLVLTMLTPDALARAGPVGLLRLWQSVPPDGTLIDGPGRLVALLGYSFFSSDVVFAAVFILALPGAEPITPRARRIYLLLAGLTAAAIHRYAPALPVPLPAATLTLAAFQPFTWLFDRALTHRSWLNK